MRELVFLLSLAIVGPLDLLWAQLSPPNEAGVAMGHLHFTVRDVEANKKFWMKLGATPVKLGTREVMKLPDVLIFLKQGEPSGNNVDEESVVEHVTFKVPDVAQALEDWKAMGIKTEVFLAGIVGFVFTPDGEKMEILRDGALNLAFDPDDGGRDVEEHHHKLTGPIAFHHIHFLGPEASLAKIRAWYVMIFGARPGWRFRYEVNDLSGVELDYLASHSATATTKGRVLDHIGFEIKNLKAFCSHLEASGVKFDVPYTTLPTGIGIAFLTDPWGTYIELTEGLYGAR